LILDSSHSALLALETFLKKPFAIFRGGVTTLAAEIFIQPRLVLF
jgi:hypothetical protein